ncbi:MAG: tyrosine-type recombinase/integrase [Acutalibacteraceae bacterium]|nr:tyrosine-type recombinase/integrase [Acutalibacteraceae bacterium]
MKKPTDFAYALSKFFSEYLTGLCNYSEHTIMSYRDTFKLFLKYSKAKENLTAEEITFAKISMSMIERFLQWLKTERNASVSTCNQRLAAIHAFFKYVQYEYPEYSALSQKILFIKFAKAPKSELSYLTVEGIALLLSIPDTATIQGRRELAILSLLYDSAARVDEIVSLCARDIRLINPASVRLTGKGRKVRSVPLLKGAVDILSAYFKDHKTRLMNKESILFVNHSGQKLTRSGITYILHKNAKEARKLHPELIPEKLTPHCLRHSKAMHLLQAGVNLIYIRDFLGHIDVKTTQIYARADVTLKRKAIEKANVVNVNPEMKSWTEDSDLMTWLENLGKK